MAHPALDDGIAWKTNLVKSNLDFVEKHMAGDKALIERLKGELRTLKTPNRASFDLVKGNLERQVANATDNLAGLNGVAAHRERIHGTPLSEELAAARRLLAELKALLDALNKEGRP